MRLEQLQYIIEIADTGSVSSASQNLFIAQPSISQSLSKLEKELGVTLFNRTRTGMEPTEIGTHIISSARIIMNEISHIEYLTKDKNEAIQTTIRLGALPVICDKILPKALADFKKKFPNVTVNIKEEGTKAICSNLKKGKIDIAILSHYEDGMLEPDRFPFYQLIKGRLMGYAAKNSPLTHKKQVTFADLIEYPIVLLCDEFFTSTYIIENLSKFGTPNIMSISSNPDSLKKIVMETDAIGFAPDISLINDLSICNGELIPFYISNMPESVFGMTWDHNRSQNKACKALTKEIIDKSNSANEILHSLRI